MVNDKKVLIVDADLRRPRLNKIFQVKNVGGLSSFLTGKIPLEDCIKMTAIDNVWILPSGPVPPNPAELIASDQTDELLSFLRSEYDYIIIDCPTSLGSMTINSMIATDYLLVPVVCEYYSLKALGKFMRAIRNISNKYNPLLRFKGILVTMYDKRLKNSKVLLQELRYTFKSIVFNTIIPRNSRISESPALGKPVALVSITSPGAIGYLQLAEEIISSKNKQRKN